MKRIPAGFLDGGAGLSKGHPCLDPDTGTYLDLATLLSSIGGSVYANATAVQALGKTDWNGIVVVAGKAYGWQASSVANDATAQLVIRPSALGASDPGRFELLGSRAALRLPVTYQTANNATLFTVPTGWKLSLDRFYYEVTTAFVNASGRVGASSSNTAYNTAGDLIGGSGGDAAAALAAGIKGGTIGTKFGSNGAVQLVADDTIKWNVIVSGYTAGAADLVVLATRV